MSTSLILGQHALFFLTSNGSDETERPSLFSAKVSDYSKGYVALVSGNALGNVGVYVGGKALGSFDLTITGHSQDGTPMTSLTRSYTVIPVPVPQATHFDATDDAVLNNNGITDAPDPGTDTVTGSL